MEQGLQGFLARGPVPARRPLAEHIRAIRQLAMPLRQLSPTPRQERLSGVHNPWGHATALVDAWPFLDLCECDALLDQVQAVIGPDIILWDSELFLDGSAYRDFVRAGRAGRYWPASPLAGAVVLVGLGASQDPPVCVDIHKLSDKDLAAADWAAGLYVIRYMAASSHFDRRIRARPNWDAMQEQPLINYTNRPLWLVRGTDRGSNDFVTGFSPLVPMWAAARPEEK